VSRERISITGSEANLRLPGEILEGLGIDVGDEVEMLIVEGTLVIRPLNEERSVKINAAVTGIIERRKSAYEELARGVD
jgi:antitoxin component of MazEF toxin-antitoxin module